MRSIKVRVEYLTNCVKSVKKINVMGHRFHYQKHCTYPPLSSYKLCADNICRDEFGDVLLAYEVKSLVRSMI